MVAGIAAAIALGALGSLPSAAMSARAAAKPAKVTARHTKAKPHVTRTTAPKKAKTNKKDRIGSARPTPPELATPTGAPARWLLDPADASASATTSTATASPHFQAAAVADDPSIAGTVTDFTTHAPLASVTVSAYSTTTTNIFTATTNASGAYSIAVPVGSFQVVFEDHVSNHVVQWWHNAPAQNTSQVVTVGSGDAITGIDAALLAGGSISGTVTDTAAHPLAGICATLEDATSVVRGGGCADASGHYQTTGVPSGSYKVVYDDHTGPFLEQWYNGAPTSATATAVAVTTGAVTSGIDASLTRGGTISGTVIDAATSLPIAGVCVYVSGPSPAVQRCTDAVGHYQSPGLGAGNYTVEFYGTQQGYLTQWYPDQSAASTATPVGVSLGVDTPGIDAHLAAGGKITGTVTDAVTHAPVADVCATVYSQVAQGAACSDATGTYTIVGLLSGSYQASFTDQSQVGYVTQYYNGKSSYANADSIGVTTGATTSHIDAAMVLGGRITGTITDAATHAPLANICVSAYAANTGTSGYGCSDPSGNYSVGGLATDSYSLHFADNGGRGYLSQSAAAPVSVTLGATTGHIDVAMVPGGQITGTVTDAVTHAPVANACVQAFQHLGGFPVAYTCTATGSYTLIGLPTGDYDIEFSGDGTSGYVTQWYDNKSTEATATTVHAVAATTVSNINAALVVGGKITGTVRDSSTNGGLAYICVEAVDHVTQSFGRIACTDSTGVYTIIGLPAATYDVLFVDQNGLYLLQWFHGQTTEATANPVTVTLGATTSAIDAAMQLGGTISGTVTDAATHAPIPGACVTVFHRSSHSEVTTMCTDVDGTYSIRGLTTDTYDVQFEDSFSGYLDQWYNNQPTETSANPVSVTAGQTTSAIDAALVSGGEITGTVTDALTNSPVASVCVEALDHTTTNFVGEACTDSSGAYTIVGLPAGSYDVGFDQGGLDVYAPQWYHNQPDEGSADPVAVTLQHTTTGIDAVLAHGASISGTITDSVSGLPVAGACASVFSATDINSQVGSACADATGAYHVLHLSPGTYFVEFTGDGFLTRWYRNKADVETADPVPVSAGQDVAGIDEGLALGASVSGTITDAGTGLPIEDACAFVFAASDLNDEVGATCTDASGVYEVGGLPAGTYVVDFQADQHIDQWYNDKPDAAHADPLALAAGSSANNVDAQLQLGGTISGTVTDATTGDPLAGVCVNAFDTTTGAFPGLQSCTDAAGQYQTQGLPNGTYNVEFVDQGGGSHADQWYDGRSTEADADPVAVSAGVDTPGIDAELTEGVSITGTVTDATSGDPIPTVCVFAFDHTTQDQVGDACTDASGSYTINNITAGSYDVFFEDFSDNGYASQWYQDEADESTADPVTLALGETASGIDAALALNGSISGTVVGQTSEAPVANVCAVADNGDSGEFGGSGAACSDDNGTYTINGLPAGSYTVRFVPEVPQYAQQYYPDATSSDGATPVDVAENTPTTGIDAHLLVGATVSGTVTEVGTGVPLANVCIDLVDPETLAVVSGPHNLLPNDHLSLCTDASGEYQTSGVPSGTYLVDFTNPSGRYIEQWWNGQPDSAHGDTVTLTFGEDTPNIDAALTLGGNLSGTVTDAETHAPVADVCAQLFRTSDDAAVGFPTCTDAAGHYTSVSVAAGSYFVEFTDPSENYATQWFNGEASSATADPVTITAGTTTPGIDAALASNSSGTTTTSTSTSTSTSSTSTSTSSTSTSTSSTSTSTSSTSTSTSSTSPSTSSSTSTSSTSSSVSSSTTSTSLPTTTTGPPVKVDQTITFPALPDTTLDASPVTAAASASSGLPVSFTTTTPLVCTEGGVDGATITLVSVGTCTVQADQAGDTTFNAAPSVLVSFAVAPSESTSTTTTSTSTSTSTTSTSTSTSTSTTSTSTTSTSTTVPSTSTSTTSTSTPTSSSTSTTVPPTSTSTSTATSTSTTEGPTTSTTELPVKTDQTITFAALPDTTLAASPVTAVASASSGLPVSFTTTTPLVCTEGGVDGATITLVSAGTCTVQADQAGDATFNAAPSVVESFAVSPTASALTTSVVGTPDPVTAGELVQYTVTVTNNGGAPATGVQVTDALPAGTTFFSASPGCVGSGPVTCSLNAIAAGGSQSVVIVVRTPASAANATITNSVTTAPGGGPAATVDTPVVAPTPGTANGFVPPGGSITTGGNNPATLTLPDTGPGAVVMLSQVGGATFCNGPCNGPATFVNSFPGYNDPRHPIDLTISFAERNYGQAQRDVDHARIYKLAEDGTSSVVPVCRADAPRRGRHHHGRHGHGPPRHHRGSGATSGVANPAPCVEPGVISHGDGGWQVSFDILYLSGDPGWARR